MPGVIGEGSPGLGIAIKISDGDAHGRARTYVSLLILSALGVLDETDMGALKFQEKRLVRNWRGIEVGELRPAFTLDFVGGK
jgi:L-asparaginase II